MKTPAFALAGLLAAGIACAEPAVTVRSTALQAQAQSDSATVATLPENTRVELVSRRGAWSEVKTLSGQSGWVRMLSLRLDGPAQGTASGQGGGNPLGALNNLLNAGRTSGNATVTTGVKGLDEEDLRRASPNFSELQKAQRFSAARESAEAFGNRSRLTPARVDYLPEPQIQPLRNNDPYTTGG